MLITREQLLYPRLSVVNSASSRPLLFGHRGVRPLPRAAARWDDLPAENTLAAFDYAVAAAAMDSSSMCASPATAARALP